MDKESSTEMNYDGHLLPKDRRTSWKSIIVGGRVNKTIILSILFATSILIFYFRVLFIFGSYVEWVNFCSPVTLAQLNGSKSFFFWNQYDGSPNLFPSTTIDNFLFYHAVIAILTYLVPLGMSIKIYFVISSLFLVLAFYKFSGAFSSSCLVRVVSSLFFMYNLFQLDQLSSGDFLVYWDEGMLLLSMYFVILASRSHRRFNIYWILAVSCLFLTLGEAQFAYLGFVMFLFFWGTNSWHKRVISDEPGFSLRNITGAIAVFGLLLTTFGPFVLPAIFGSFITLGPTSSYAPSLGNYGTFTTNFFGVLYLNPYNSSSVGSLANYSVAGFFPEWLYLIWQSFVVTFLTTLILFSMVFKDIRTRLASVLIVISALVGSGPHSPVSVLPIFLFESFPGFQMLNTSYIWDWVIISPMYSFVLIFFLDFLRGRSVMQSMRPNPEAQFPLLEHFRRLLQGGIYYVVIAVVIMILVLPISSQGYYSDNGIVNRGAFIPASSGNLTDELIQLTSNGAGVAFFPPGPQMYFGNSSDQFTNSIYVFQPFREAVVPSYGSVPTAISNYFSWVYGVFYNNETRHLGQLMGVAGIYYYVILKNATNFPDYYHSNPMKLMQWQSDVNMIINTKNYSIYQSSLPVISAVSFDKYTFLVSKKFSGVSTISNNGYDLVQHPIIMLQDLNPYDYKYVFGNISTVFINNRAQENYIALRLLVGEEISPIAYVDSSFGGWNAPREPNINWVNANNYYVPEVTTLPLSPENVVFTTSNQSLNLTVPGTSQENTLLIEVYSSPVSGNMTFSVGGHLVATLHTLTHKSGVFNLVELPYTFDNRSTLTLYPKGLNDYYIDAIGNAYLVNKTKYDAALRVVESELSNTVSYNFSSIFLPSNVTISNSQILNLTLTQDGYSLSTRTVNSKIWVDYPFFQDETSNGRMFPALGGVNTILIAPSQGTVHVEVSIYSYWVIGEFVQMTGFSTFLLLGYTETRRYVGGRRYFVR